MVNVPEFPGLVNELVHLLLAHQAAFGQQRVFERVIALDMVGWARHTCYGRWVFKMKTGVPGIGCSAEDALRKKPLLGCCCARRCGM